MQRPGVGVGVIVIKEGKVLLGKRTDSHGVGSFCWPGGHLENWETIEECARREVLEEAGVEVENIRLGPYTNDFFEKEGKHYVTLCVITDWKSGEARVLKKEKMSDWQWFNWNDLPSPLFLSCENLVKSGFNPFR